jgi:hypothetical protein
VTFLTVGQVPRGQFLSDSIKIGQPIQYALSLRHNAKADIFFPDKKYNFAPFEFVDSQFFSTSTNSKGSLDSVVYTLTSFEVNPVQQLSLPIYIRKTQDCTAVFAAVDSVYLQEMIRSERNLKALALYKNTNIIHLEPQLNYPLIGIWALAFLVFGSIVFWVFGKPIRKQLSLYRFGRRYDEFLKLFQKLLKTSDDHKIKDIEKAVVLWKKYIERLENKPFTTFTTREILDNLADTRLAGVLREVDATVYGGVLSEKTTESLNVLKDLATQLYQEHRQILVEEK